MKLVTLEGLSDCKCGGRCNKCRRKRGCCPQTQNSQPVNVNVITNTGWQDAHSDVIAPTTLAPSRTYVSPSRSVERDVLVREVPKNITINMPKPPAGAPQPAPTGPRAQAVQQTLHPQMVQRIRHPKIEFY